MYNTLAIICNHMQALRKSEGSAERLEHLMKIRDQSIKTLQQEITVIITPY